MFWTEWDTGEKFTKSSIARAHMDGTDVMRIIYQDIYWPNSLAVDYIPERLFFADAKRGLIESSDLDGSSRRVIMRSIMLQPFSITIFEDQLYWTDTARKAIFQASKFDGSGNHMIRRNVKSPMGISIIHRSRQAHGNYNCGKDNGGCSHICLPSSSGRSCTCPTGFQMLNSTHCAEKIDKFVAYVGDYVVRQISLDTDDMLDVVLPFEYVVDVIAMDWDPITDAMYWAGSYDDEITIRKGKMRPPYYEAVVQKISGKLSGIGVDWLTRKLYWSEEERNHILVSTLDGSSSTVVLWRKIVKPRNLLLHVEKRYLYWTSHGSVVSINRAGMDGFSREKIISGGLINPSDLTLDKVKNILYWVDGGEKVYYISLETRKRNFYKVSYYSTTLNPFTIGIDGDRFFWTDSNLKKVLLMNLGEKNDAKVIGKYKSNPVRLAVFEQVQGQENHPCTSNNGNCSHLCVLSPSQTFRCFCPAGRHLRADNKTCQDASEMSRFVLVNSNGRLYQVPLSVPYKTDIMITSEGNKDVFAFDVDVKHRSVYFIKKTIKKKEMCHVSLSGGNHTCILSDILRAPGDIAYDPVRHYIYWTDFLTKKIYLAGRNGEFWTVIIWKNLDLPSSITIAYQHGRQPDASLENYVTSTIMDVIANFFTSPFSQCSTTIDAHQLVFVKILQSVYRLSQCSSLTGSQKYNVENCIRTLCEVAKTRSIAIPGDLDAQITMMFNQTIIMAKSTQKWLSRGKKKESVVNKPISKDYRNIIEGLQDIVCLLEEQLRPLIQAEESVLVDILYKPELMFPPKSECRSKSEKGGFISRLIKHTERFVEDEEGLCIQVLQHLRNMVERETRFGRKAANLRSLLLKRYFGDNYPKIMEASEDKTSQTKNTSVRGDTRILKRAGVSLAEMQCQLNNCGATDLVIDIIMKKPSYHVFVECIKLGISLLEGGNHLIQISFYGRFVNGKSEAFFQNVHDKMKEADSAIKNNMIVMAESNCVTSESSETPQGNAQQNTAKSTSGRKNTFGTGLHTLPSYLDMSDEVKEQLADAATHTTRAYAVVRRSRQPDADTEHGKTGASENRSLASARSPGFNGGSSVALNEVLLVKPIMRILQLLCENHNHHLQNYIREQDNKTSYNLVLQTLQFLDCICGSTSGSLGLLGLYINEDNVELIKQCLESLTEYCQGPCPENQNDIALHDSNGVDIISALVVNDINPLAKQRMDLVLELKNNACKALLAILESRNDSENAERILCSLSPKQLVESCKKVYDHEGFNNNNDFECDISPRDVGHNIYILAHQVCIPYLFSTK
ncbi:inositol 1,4,5-trisphosphate receptor-like [Paramuricea clavata]|uniref:Inositol 1,4,5-trisphosphate receptor-like n=2 Tax=Paramuricea clavata TaxID=317549 RepID=A0A6S7H4S0_PARCT|nr:inositol 1,4,5-trisphosphate receptor-like [Paramuricea clavata]